RRIKLCRREVLSEKLGVTIGFLHADGAHGSAAQTFEAERAGAGEQLDHTRAFHACAEAVEHGLADEVGSGSDIKPLGHFEQPSARSSTDDAHASIMKTGSSKRQEIFHSLHD